MVILVKTEMLKSEKEILSITLRSLEWEEEMNVENVYCNFA